MKTIDFQPMKRFVITTCKPMKGHRFRTAVNQGHVLQITA